jgi:hypothetical protein
MDDNSLLREILAELKILNGSIQKLLNEGTANLYEIQDKLERIARKAN